MPVIQPCGHHNLRAILPDARITAADALRPSEKAIAIPGFSRTSRPKKVAALAASPPSVPGVPLSPIPPRVRSTTPVFFPFCFSSQSARTSHLYVIRMNGYIQYIISLTAFMAQMYPRRILPLVAALFITARAIPLTTPRGIGDFAIVKYLRRSAFL